MPNTNSKTNRSFNLTPRAKKYLNFIFVVLCIVNLLYVTNQRDAVLSSLFIVLQNHSTCFKFPLHPSSGVHKTAVTTTGTGHVYW